MIGAIMGFLSAINAILLGAGVYEMAAAGIVTGFLAALGVLLNELLVRPEVVPIKPLEQLANEVHPPV